ncbi:uncharacterized protein VP01_310g13 [Puccinia sorghi]|uniref:Uncharacterized protein n=1 Tax=Puccinia sorghi TaxID=27349 RepID=A0A0L6V187_9BASI|nr:uncharacterized protein VP01_310g13 [Puccinia sorghi]
MTHPQPSIRIRHRQDSEAAAKQGEQEEQAAGDGRDRLHLMPFSIDYHGPAEISKYFLIRPDLSAQTSAAPGTADGQSDHEMERFEASFRGRYLHGTRLKIPDGYSGLVLSSSSSSSSSLPPPPSAKSPSITTPAPPPTHSLTRGRGRGRGRARGGRRQAVGTREPVTRDQLKRKQSEIDEFLDRDSDHDDADQQQADIRRHAMGEDAMHKGSYSVAAAGAAPDAVPAGYHASVASSHPPPVSSAGPSPPTLQDPHHKLLSSVGRFQHITLWNPDHQMDLSNDVYARALLESVTLAHLAPSDLVH